MSIRKDFEPVVFHVERLLVYSKQFDEFNTLDWSHLKNQEDFREVYNPKIGAEVRQAFEEVYRTGRNCAFSMSTMLVDFNDVGRFPTLRSYVDHFDKSWVNQTEELKKITIRAEEVKRISGCNIWAVDAMISLFEKQLGLLDAVRSTLAAMKRTRLYRMEAGEEIDMNDPISSVNITGNFQGIVGNITNSQVTQTINANVQQDDFGSLSKFLTTQGVGQADIQLLEQAIKDDPKPTNHESLGKNVNNWIGEMVKKALGGTWKFGAAVAAGVLARAIAKYYGF